MTAGSKGPHVVACNLGDQARTDLEALCHLIGLGVCARSDHDHERSLEADWLVGLNLHEP